MLGRNGRPNLADGLLSTYTYTDGVVGGSRPGVFFTVGFLLFGDDGICITLGGRWVSLAFFALVIPFSALFLFLFLVMDRVTAEGGRGGKLEKWLYHLECGLGGLRSVYRVYVQEAFGMRSDLFFPCDFASRYGLSFAPQTGALRL
jgi:hypothetical protein